MFVNALFWLPNITACSIRDVDAGLSDSVMLDCICLVYGASSPSYSLPQGRTWLKVNTQWSD